VNTYLVKQVIIARRDLNMPAGKLAAQVAHASMSFMSRGLIRPEPTITEDPWSHGVWFGEKGAAPEIQLESVLKIEERKLIVDQVLALWLDGAFAKIVLMVHSEEHLLELYNLANLQGLRTSLILDEGRTVFKGVPTHTCVAIGPNLIERIDRVTKGLPLYK
jgi:PTH2 family peptidyl-tRNA hydrolase